MCYLPSLHRKMPSHRYCGLGQLPPPLWRVSCPPPPPSRGAPLRPASIQTPPPPQPSNSCLIWIPPPTGTVYWDQCSAFPFLGWLEYAPQPFDIGSHQSSPLVPPYLNILRSFFWHFRKTQILRYDWYCWIAIDVGLPPDINWSNINQNIFFGLDGVIYIYIYIFIGIFFWVFLYFPRKHILGQCST